MPELTELLQQKRPILSDGAWGTQLKSRGLSGCPELWNLTEPRSVLAVARSYVEAGSEIILTNSFGGSPYKLASYGLEDKTEELNQRAAALSREAAGAQVVVLGSVGPTGKFLKPYGPVEADRMEEAFRRQIAGLLAGGADGVCIETMSDLGEADCAVRAARAEGARAVVVSMTFERKKTGMVTMMGVRPEQAAEHFAAVDVTAVGANCGAGADDMLVVIQGMGAVSSLPLWAKPNAGIPRVEGARTTYPESPGEMAGKIAALCNAGASVVGGCCGTTPDHIRAFAAVLRV